MRRFSILVLFFAACATTQPLDVRKNANDFAAAASHGNVDGMVSFYADDAILMPPGAPVMNGKAAIRQFWSGLTSLGAIDAKLTTDDVIQSGNLAAETGHFELSITPQGAPNPIKDNGKYLVVWRNDGGEWKIVRDIFNSSVPPPAH